MGKKDNGARSEIRGFRNFELSTSLFMSRLSRQSRMSRAKIYSPSSLSNPKLGHRRDRLWPSIRPARRSPRQTLLPDQQRTENTAKHRRAEVFRPADSSQAQHKIVLSTVWELQIEEPQRPALAGILIEGDDIVLRALAVLHVVVALGANRPTPRCSKPAACRDKLEDSQQLLP